MIREASTEDAESIYMLLDQNENETPSFEEFRACFIHNVNSNKILMCEENGKVLGCGIISYSCPLHHSAKVAEVELIIASNYPWRWIGKQFFAAITKEAQKNGCKYIELTPNQKRLNVQNMFKSEGFSFTHYKITKNLEEVSHEKSQVGNI